MNKTFEVFKHELLGMLKARSFLIFTLAVPLLIIVGYVAYQGIQKWYEPTDSPVASIGYVDHTGLFSEYTSQPPFNLIQFVNEEAARESLLSGQIREYFIIPQDYLYTGLTTRYTTAREMDPPSDTVRAMRDFFLSNLLAEDTGPEVLERVKNPVAMVSYRLDESGSIASDQNWLSVFLFPYAFAILMIMSILVTSGSLLESVSEEKENRLIEVLLSSVSARQLLTGKVLGLGVAGLLQILVWFLSIWIFVRAAGADIPVLGDISLPISMLLLAIAYYVVGYLLFAAIYAGLGSVAPTMREAQGWSGVIATAAALPVILAPAIVQHPDNTLAQVLTFFPVTTPVAAVMRLAADGLPAWQVALSMVVLAASVAFCIWAAAKIFRTTLLMYGKRPSLKDVVRAVREA